jgi:threonine dehydratase
VDAETDGIAADSLAPRRVGERVFPIAQRHVERVILVPDEAIIQAQQTLWSTARVVAEPGGATSFAAVVARRYVPYQGERMAVLISGGNTSAVPHFSL